MPPFQCLFPQLVCDWHFAGEHRPSGCTKNSLIRYGLVKTKWESCVGLPEPPKQLKCLEKGDVYNPWNRYYADPL